MEKFDPQKFLEEMKAIMEANNQKLKEEINETMEDFRKEIKTPQNQTTPKYQVRIEWEITQVKNQGEVEITIREIQNLMIKYNLVKIDAKKVEIQK